MKVQLSHAIFFDLSLPWEPSMNDPAILIYMLHLDTMKSQVPVRRIERTDEVNY